MIPSALIAQLQQGMKDFLRASFWSTTQGFDEMLAAFIDGVGTREHPLFRGPYVSMKLPFESGQAGADFFEKVPMDFPPYRHQEEAFRRLGGSERKNTIVATGTGSGKTESFLHPILAECERLSGRQGVKAILIYPMNALAQDQAERIAKMIDGNPHLKNKVRAGLYVGSKSEVIHSQMGPGHVITDKELLRDDPPDILLTNYKMLDYLMIRPRDQVIWHHNEPETLKFLVVDELHTFDGAQGTDLASLIRRLKARLRTPERHLTCVGTSATLGDAPKSIENLLDYAAEIFGEPFEKEAVIREWRVEKDVFLTSRSDTYSAREGADFDIVPGPEKGADLDPTRYEDPQSYIEAQQKLWFQRTFEPIELGVALKDHFFLERLLVFVRDQPRSMTYLIDKLRREADFSEEDTQYIEAILTSFLALTAHARDENGRPFLHLRVELWQREMRRMVASVRPTPRLSFYDDLDRENSKNHLPVIYCRECGTMGWATMIEKDRPFRIASNLRDFYRAYFSHDDRVAYLFPKSCAISADVKKDPWFVNSRTLERKRQKPEDNTASTDEEDLWFPAVFPENTRKTQYGLRAHTNCPACEAKNSLSLLGFQAASLTSAYINQLFASRFNDHKKLLTFSDSVQDAAHRAGFFEARTWRFNLRIAIQRVVDDTDGDIPLAQLADRVVEDWRDKLGDVAFAATFIAPDMAWLSEYQLMIDHVGGGKEPKTDRLIEQIRRRIYWEVVSEYSLQARIGRTLPRTGASIASIDPVRVEAAVNNLVAPLRNEVGGLQKISAEHLHPLVTGLLRRLLYQGAVFHDEIHESYLASGGEKIYVMSQWVHHLPNFSPHSRLPVFLASRSGTARFDALSHRREQTWYERYFSQAMAPLGGLVADEAPYALRMILDELVRSEVLERQTYGGTHLWGFRLDALRVTGDVAALQEEETGSVVTVAEADVDAWLKTPAIGPRGGAHTRFEGENEAYYARLYKSGDVLRIVADEHTGLLTRTDREEVERRFKDVEPKPWYPNLLSCTPTLEMGIDVGDLSTAILCSVPPSQANYLQRIGRAGRRDGNSLLITLAGARDHDIFFFLEPEEMIAGHVDTPGVFLNASAVLERQLTAFAFDRWAASGVGPDELPPRLGDVLNNLQISGSTGFPYSVIDFIEDQGDGLLAEFQFLFEEHLSDQARDYLTGFMHGDEQGGYSLMVRILDAFQEAQKDRKSHGHSLREMERRIKKLKKEPVLGEDMKKELESTEDEFQATRALIAQINGRKTMEFLTTRGLLPNYAFPEAGVTLQSVIWRKRSEEERGDKKYINFKYEFERPASAAIREFAPRNYFYAGGRQVEIDRIAVDREQIETWQFCDVCHHAEKVIEKSDKTSCSECGSEGFGNAAGQIYKMVRLRQVYANTHDRDSRIGDEREERKPRFYNRRMLVTTAGTGQQSQVIDDETRPFGYSYITRTRFREINFGEYTDDGEVGKNGQIAGSEEVRQGFSICADCGMVQPETRRKDKERKHSYGCVSRRKNHTEKFEDCLFLYRDFDAESIHLLLPFARQPGYETKLHSFVAAFQMGMKDFFGGRVDHLEATDFTDQGPEESGMRQFLVLYDRVPGGTGYLKDLMLPTEEGRSKFFVIFEKALQKLASCTCSTDPEKDGCYRCLYAYRNSFEMPETSREIAIDILSELLEVEDKLEVVDNLDNVSVSGLIDSVLEANLLDKLAHFPESSLKKEMVQSISGYAYRLADKKWEILPQRDRTTQDGLATNVSIDFLFAPADSSDEGRPLAIFTDGFQYHKKRIGHDFFQRMALSQSGQAYTFSLTWGDVEAPLFEPSSYAFDFLDIKGDPIATNLFEGLCGTFGVSDFKDCAATMSMSLLRQYLSTDDGEYRERSWQRFAMALGAAKTRPGDFDTWKEELREYAPATLWEILVEEPLGRPLLASIEGPEGATPIRIFISFDQTAMSEFEPEHLRVLVWLDDDPELRDSPEFRKTWNGALRLFNILQFLPNAFFVTSTSKGEYDFGELINSRPRLAGAALDMAESYEWKELRDMLASDEPALGVFVDRLFEERRPLPTEFFSIVNEAGREVTGVVDLAWPEFEVAILDFEHNRFMAEATEEEFHAHDWTVLDMADVVAHPQLILDLVPASI